MPDLIQSYAYIPLLSLLSKRGGRLRKVTKSENRKPGFQPRAAWLEPTRPLTLPSLFPHRSTCDEPLTEYNSGQTANTLGCTSFPIICSTENSAPSSIYCLQLNHLGYDKLNLVSEFLGGGAGALMYVRARGQTQVSFLRCCPVWYKVSDSLEPTITLGWLASPCLPSAGIMSIHHHAWLFLHIFVF